MKWYLNWSSHKNWIEIEADSANSEKGYCLFGDKKLKDKKMLLTYVC